MEVPQQLVFANDLQRAGEYAASRKYYRQFFEEHPEHTLRFKALFEIGDNYYYEKNKKKAREAYQEFQRYCSSQEELTQEEEGWVQAYQRLAQSRLSELK